MNNNFLNQFLKNIKSNSIRFDREKKGIYRRKAPGRKQSNKLTDQARMTYHNHLLIFSDHLFED